MSFDPADSPRGAERTERSERTAEPVGQSAFRARPAGRGGGRGHDDLPLPLELIVALVTALAVLIAAAVNEGFSAAEAWLYVTILAFAYIVARGLADRR